MGISAAATFAPEAGRVIATFGRADRRERRVKYRPNPAEALILLGDPREHIEQSARGIDEAKCQLLGALITAHQFGREAKPSLTSSHRHDARHRGAQSEMRVPIVNKDAAEGPVYRDVINTEKS